MKNLIVLFVFLSSSAFSFAQPSHEAFDTLLKKHVSATGKVNYKNLKADKAALEAYLKLLSDNMPVDKWSKNDKFAYWINAYNVYSIKIIISAAGSPGRKYCAAGKIKSSSCLFCYRD